MTILDEIEKLRMELNEAIERNQGLSEDEVMRISEQLDMIICEFHKDQSLNSAVGAQYIQ